MNFLSRAHSESPSLPLAPMIDIIFLLLIFFITTSVFARMENELSVTVPTAESADPPRRQLGEIIINLTWDGGIVVNQREMTDSQLLSLLSRLVERYPDQAVIVRGDRTTQWEDMVNTLDICARAGIWNYKFAALPPEPEAQE